MKTIKFINDLIDQALAQKDESGRAAAEVLESIKMVVCEDMSTMIPREAVQAAVNEINAGLLRAETNACNGANTYFADGAIAAYKDALQEIEEHCGVAPEKEMGEE